MSAEPQGQLFVVSAPSGAGKTSLVQALVHTAGHIVTSVSHTTRTMRPGERDGADYHFVSVPEFETMAARGDFLEYARVFGNLYGTSRSAVDQALAAGQDVVLDIDWQGARLIRAIYPAVVTIFIVPPSAAELRRRLEARGEDPPEIIESRMQAAVAEISHYPDYDYLVVNEVFDGALEDLRAIVRAARLKTPVQRLVHAAELARLMAS